MGLLFYGACHYPRTIYGGEWRVSDRTYIREYDTCDTIGMGLSWMAAPLCTVYIRRLFWDLFGGSENCLANCGHKQISVSDAKIGFGGTFSVFLEMTENREYV